MLPVFYFVIPCYNEEAVLPISAPVLKEKLLAAKKAEIKTVLVPEKNEPEIREIDKEITEGMKIVYVREMQEVLEKALLLARNYYAKASSSDRQSLKSEILNSEKELEALQLEIKKEEKKQRNSQYQNN